MNSPSDFPPIGYLSPAWPIEDMPNGIVSYIAIIRQGLKSQGVASSVFVSRKPRSGEPDVVAVPSSWTLRDRVGRALRRKMGMPSDSHVPFVRELRAKLSECAQRGLKVFEMDESFGLSDRVAVPGVAQVVRLHGPWFLNGEALGEEQNAAFQARVRKEGRAIKNAAAITAPSKDVLERVREYYRLRLPHARVIANPGPQVALEECWDKATAKRKQILFIGRFDRHKGGDLMLRAFARLASADGEVTLMFAGPDRGLMEDGASISLPQYVARHIPEALRPRLECLGPLGPERLADLRRESALCVVPSRYDNFPVVVLEALAFGCPIVGAATGGISEMISHGENGLLFQPENVDELVAQISRLLSEPEVAEHLARGARRTYESRFEPGRVASDTLDLYRSLPNCSNL